MRSFINSAIVMLMLFHYQFNCYDFSNYISLFVVLQTTFQRASKDKGTLYLVNEFSRLRHNLFVLE